MQVSDNKLVTVEYKLYVKNSDGSLELMEETTADNPLIYIHGTGTMMPKFEELMHGKNTDEKFEFSVACPDAYGEYSDENVLELPLDVFTADGSLDKERFFEGAIVPLVDSTGQRLNAEIVEIGQNSITVDLNHPLAGEDLFFTGKILDVHQPSEAELQSLTSCNCGSCNCAENGCGSCGI
jgi:FKBP-type peptidyl-prolyl cis-trans isomerase SlyD